MNEPTVTVEGLHPDVAKFALELNDIIYDKGEKKGSLSWIYAFAGCSYEKDKAIPRANFNRLLLHNAGYWQWFINSISRPPSPEEVWNTSVHNAAAALLRNRVVDEEEEIHHETKRGS